MRATVFAMTGRAQGALLQRLRKFGFFRQGRDTVGGSRGAGAVARLAEPRVGGRKRPRNGGGQDDRHSSPRQDAESRNLVHPPGPERAKPSNTGRAAANLSRGTVKPERHGPGPTAPHRHARAPLRGRRRATPTKRLYGASGKKTRAAKRPTDSRCTAQAVKTRIAQRLTASKKKGHPTRRPDALSSQRP